MTGTWNGTKGSDVRAAAGSWSVFLRKLPAGERAQARAKLLGMSFENPGTLKNAAKGGPLLAVEAGFCLNCRQVAHASGAEGDKLKTGGITGAAGTGPPGSMAGVLWPNLPAVR